MLIYNKKSASQLKYFSLSDFSFSLFSLTQNRNENIENCTQITAAKSCHKSFRLKSSVFFVYLFSSCFFRSSVERKCMDEKTPDPRDEEKNKNSHSHITRRNFSFNWKLHTCKNSFIKIHLVYYKYCSHGDN